MAPAHLYGEVVHSGYPAETLHQTEGLNDHSACHAHRVIADRAVDLLSAAQSLEGTDEYKRLQTAFLERGMID